MPVKESLYLEAAADHRIDQSTAERAEALFTSDLSAWVAHTPAEVAAAVRQAIRVHGGIEGCMAAMASAYGDHPETAAPRMRWARAVAHDSQEPSATADALVSVPF